MIARWGACLVVALSLIAVSLGGFYWAAEANSLSQHDLRQLRLKQQELEQQLVMLRNPTNSVHLTELEQGIDALQLELVELLFDEERPTGVLDIDYEQHLLARSLMSGDGSDVTILRLMLNLSVQHSVAMLAMIDKINNRISTWPHEIRACELRRKPLHGLGVQCALDFYHWSNPASQKSIISAAKR